MSDKYNEVLANLTAEDQIYAFEEVTHSSGITYREFKNTPKTLASFLSLDCYFQNGNLLFLMMRGIAFKTSIRKLLKQPML